MLLGAYLCVTIRWIKCLDNFSILLRKDWSLTDHVTITIP